LSPAGGGGERSRGVRRGGFGAVSRSAAHPFLPALKRQLAAGRVDRREFLRTATLLGLSSAAAYGLVGGSYVAGPARARMPKGGTLRIGMAVQDVSNPHAFEWWEHNIARQVCEYLTKTGYDNLTRPYLLENWQASDDLRTWTLRVRQDVTWHNGRKFTADDVIWNIEHVLDEATGSSVVGFMKGYMLDDYEKDGKKHTRLWDANAIERLDSHTVRLNCKTPQLAVPEHLFHYPFLILDPEEGGKFGPGGNGTGAFELIEHEVGKRSVLQAREAYWGEGPYLERLEFIDLGEDPAAAVDALASQRIHGLHFLDFVQLDALKLLPHLQLYDVTTADTAVIRGKVTHKPFDDPRVRKALRLAIDPKRTQELLLGDLGLPAEHHHVCPIHPEYARLPEIPRDVEKAKELLTAAGYPDGIDLGKIDCKSSPSWENNAVQAIVEQWKAAGIRCKINLMPASDFWAVWDKTPFGFTEWAHRPLGVMALELAYRTGVPWNESDYANPAFDRLLTKAGGLLDAEERREVMREIEFMMQEDGPIVQPLWRSVVTVMDKRVQGFKMHPTRYLFGNEMAIES
jgi:peptide/nickel transport system substrate-binding protein